MTNEEFIHAQVNILNRHIAASIDTVSEISLVRRRFLPKGVTLVPVITEIMGIDNRRIYSMEILVTTMETDVGTFDVRLTVVDALPFSVLVVLDTTTKYAESIDLNTREIKWQMMSRIPQDRLQVGIDSPGVSKNHARLIMGLAKEHTQDVLHRRQ